MSTDGNHRQAHMMLTARTICGVFPTYSFNFGPPTYIIVLEGHCMLCSIEIYFFKESRACCLTMV